jgi:sterol 3beta-glucosyltransferase
VVFSTVVLQPLYRSLESKSEPPTENSHPPTDYRSQPFWGNMVAAAGAGPRPIDHKALSVTTLAKTIEFLLHPSAMEAASRIASKMQHENGVKEAVRSFHRNLPVETLNCDLLPRNPATWCWKRGKRTLKLSHRAASILVDNKNIEASSLKM